MISETLTLGQSEPRRNGNGLGLGLHSPEHKPHNWMQFNVISKLYFSFFWRGVFL